MFRGRLECRSPDIPPLPPLTLAVSQAELLQPDDDLMLQVEVVFRCRGPLGAPGPQDD